VVRNKKGHLKKWPNRYRTATTAYPCFLPDLGEFSGSWSYRPAGAKVENYFMLHKIGVVILARIFFLPSSGPDGFFKTDPVGTEAFTN